MQSVILEEDRLEHFRRGHAIYQHTGRAASIQDFCLLLDGDQSAHFVIAQVFGALDDRLDILTLLVSRNGKAVGSQFSQHSAYFRLEQNQNGYREEADEPAQYPRQHLQLENGSQKGYNDQYREEPRDHGRAAGTPDELQRVIDPRRQNADFHDRF